MAGIAYNGTVIFPKYNVGDIRYFPRVYDRYHEDESIDGDYTVIRRKVVFEPSVKAKEVRAVEITIGYDRNINTAYRLLTVGETEDIIFRIAKAYNEAVLENRSYATYDEAMTAAEHAASEKRTLYD